VGIQQMVVLSLENAPCASAKLGMLKKTHNREPWTVEREPSHPMTLSVSDMIDTSELTATFSIFAIHGGQ
jgi:hypothetical protein